MKLNNQDATAFVASVNRQLHEKYIIQGEFNGKIWWMLFHELGLIKE